jgi:hypothetical protein
VGCVAALSACAVERLPTSMMLAGEPIDLTLSESDGEAVPAVDQHVVAAEVPADSEGLPVAPAAVVPTGHQAAPAAASIADMDALRLAEYPEGESPEEARARKRQRARENWESRKDAVNQKRVELYHAKKAARLEASRTADRVAGEASDLSAFAVQPRAVASCSAASVFANARALAPRTPSAGGPSSGRVRVEAGSECGASPAISVILSRRSEW